MFKFNYEFKLKCVELLNKNLPLPKVDGTSDYSFRREVLNWKKIIEEIGKDALMDNYKIADYPLKTKIKAVKRIIKGEKMRAVARSLGMNNHCSVRRWYLDYLKDGIAGLQYRKGIHAKRSVEISEPMKKKLTDKEIEELKALRKRNEILEIENEYLKKLDALVSKREKEEAKAKKHK